MWKLQGNSLDYSQITLLLHCGHLKAHCANLNRKRMVQDLLYNAITMLVKRFIMFSVHYTHPNNSYLHINGLEPRTPNHHRLHYLLSDLKLGIPETVYHSLKDCWWNEIWEMGETQRKSWKFPCFPFPCCHQHLN